MDICHLHVNARPPLNYCLAAPSGISKIMSISKQLSDALAPAVAVWFLDKCVCLLPPADWPLNMTIRDDACRQPLIEASLSIHSISWVRHPGWNCVRRHILREGTEYLTMSNHSSTWGSSHWTNDIKNIFDNAENCLVRFIWYTHDLRIQRAS